MNTQVKNQKGLGIIEVLIAGGMMAIISLGVITLISDAYKSQRGLQAKDMQREVIAEITLHLSDKDACLFTFTGKTLPTPKIVLEAFYKFG